MKDRYYVVPVTYHGQPNSHVVGYRIAEIVTPQGNWITWEGLYKTKESAQAALDEHLERKSG